MAAGAAVGARPEAPLAATPWPTAPFRDAGPCPPFAATLPPLAATLLLPGTVADAFLLLALAPLLLARCCWAWFGTEEPFPSGTAGAALPLAVCCCALEPPLSAGRFGELEPALSLLWAAAFAAALRSALD